MKAQWNNINESTRLNIFAMCFMLLISFSGTKANAGLNETEEANLLFTSISKSSTSLVSPDEDQTEIEVKFNPADVPESSEKFDREKFIQEAQAEMNAVSLTEGIHLWKGPNTEEQLQSILELNDTEISSFLNKKLAFSLKLVKTLNFFRVSKEKINKALKEVNNR